VAKKLETHRLAPFFCSADLEREGREEGREGEKEKKGKKKREEGVCHSFCLTHCMQPSLAPPINDDGADTEREEDGELEEVSPGHYSEREEGELMSIIASGACGAVVWAGVFAKRDSSQKRRAVAYWQRVAAALQLRSFPLRSVESLAKKWRQRTLEAEAAQGFPASSSSSSSSSSPAAAGGGSGGISVKRPRPADGFHLAEQQRIAFQPLCQAYFSEKSLSRTEFEELRAYILSWQ
jgi:hypothetical protein